MYCKRGFERIWKLGDFSKAASKCRSEEWCIDRTHLAMDGYRSPELIERAVFNNKIDIWATGCILNRLLNAPLQFANDFDVLAYVRQINQYETPDWCIPIDSYLAPLKFAPWERAGIRKAVLQTLAPDPGSRPPAAELVKVFAQMNRVGEG